jgi:hypothetical protein
MAGPDTDHDVNWFASLSLKSGSCVTMAAGAFDLGSVIEEALKTLNLWVKSQTHFHCSQRGVLASYPSGDQSLC